MENVAFELLGLPTEYHGKPPSIGSFPNKYSRSSRSVWNEMFSDPHFLANMNSYPYIGEQWQYAINRLFTLCRRRGIMVVDASRTQNNLIRSHLKVNREKIVQYIDSLRLLPNIRLMQPRHTIDLHDKGFTLTAVSEVSIPRMSAFSHHTEIISFLDSKVWVPTGNLMRQRTLGPSITFNFGYGTSVLPALSYSIRCEHYPDLKTHQGNLAPLNEVQGFLLRMYQGILKERQFQTIRTKATRW